MKTLLSAIVLAALPSLSFAMCAGAAHTVTAQSCADGMVWDATASACVAQVGS